MTAQRLGTATSHNPAAVAPTAIGSLQRACACGTRDQSDRPCCRTPPALLQRHASRHPLPVQVPPIVHEVARASGEAIDPEVRTFFEARFSDTNVLRPPSGLAVSRGGAKASVSMPNDPHEREAETVATRVVQRNPSSGHETSRTRPDFSGVRVHTDAKAAESARAVGALAYTIGRHIVFGRGQYAPRMPEGRRLLAHELAHVVQQGPTGQRSDDLDGQVLSRTPTKDGIPQSYIYSTNCGWIDWDHADGGAARKLLADVHSASETLRLQQERQQAPPGAHQVEAGVAGRALSDECPHEYEPGEKTSSTLPSSASFRTEHSPEFDTHLLMGFEVAKWDATRLGPYVAPLAQILEADASLGVELWGFSDCLGEERYNTNLRARRALAVKALLPERVQTRITVVTFAPRERFVASNASREGRHANRSVALKILRPLTPQQRTFRERSGYKAATVSRATMTFRILQPLSADEERRVALSIFQRVSVAFEETQRFTNWIKKSHFSEEDLPSNVIGFHSVVQGLSRPAIEKLCGAWDEAHSKQFIEGYDFSQQNRSFTPRWLPAGGAWPTAFSSLQPEPEGRLWSAQSIENQYLRFGR